NGIDIPDGSSAPNLGDFTQFVTTTPSTPVSRTFVVQNTGTGTLTISSVVTDAPAVFTVTTDPTGTIAAGNNANLVIECQSATPATYNAIVTITNDDVAPEDVYTFEIECTVATAGTPEIEITGNGVEIVNLDVTPSLADHTDFGSTTQGIALSRTFTINNLGAGDLNITTPITVPAGFTVTTQPGNLVTAGNSTTFTIECTAAASGTSSGTVSIANNDSSENPYEFNITCNVNVVGTGADLSLSKIVSDLTPQFGDIITYTVTVNNVGPGATTGVQVVDTFPTSVTFLAVGTVSQGTVTVDGSNLFLTWDIGTLPNPATVTLTYTVQVNPTVGTTNNYAQITASSATDPNSTPNNGVPPTPIEDDEAAIAFLFDPPFGDKAFVYDGVSVVTWTVIWVNPSTQPIPVSMSDPLLGGTTFVSGSLTCTTFGASTQTTCAHNSGTNTIEFTGTIAPNPGATIADVNTASNRLVITYSVVVPDGVDSVVNTATLTDTDTNNTVVTTETFTRTGTPPPTTGGGGTPPLTREEIDAKVTALPATGETPWWADVLRIGLMAGVALGGAGAVWMLRRRRVA
ncbi:MAG: choice-of-anchor D domain-containing protein, partial [Anaerolineae bacterium]|nr:choice-of-anchor D domain-containing protein [Anaerolineae bacterium]